MLTKKLDNFVILVIMVFVIFLRFIRMLFFRARKFLVFTLISSLVFTLLPIHNLHVSATNDKTDGDTPYNADRSQPQQLSYKLNARTNGDAYVDTFTGGARYGYAFNLPAGRNKFTPQLSLNYSSHGGNNESVTGYGFRIEEGFIKRTSLYGVDRMYETNEFELNLFGKTQTLIPSLDNTDSFYGRYIGKYAEDFWRYELRNDNSWKLTDPEGKEYILGQTSGERQGDSENTSRIYRYMVSSIKDTNGNFIKYRYLKAHGNIYPKEISYTGDAGTDGNKTIRFYPFYDGTSANPPAANRKDTFVSYTAGFRTLQPYLLNKLQIFVDTKPVREYTFTYINGWLISSGAWIRKPGSLRGFI